MPTKKLHPHEDSLDFINSIEATCANLRCQIDKTFGPRYSLYVLSFRGNLENYRVQQLDYVLRWRPHGSSGKLVTEEALPTFLKHHHELPRLVTREA